MDKLTEFYSDKENLNKLGNFLKRMIRKNGLFHSNDDVLMTIEDIVQDTYLNLIKSKKRYDCKINTIIYKAAKNKALTELRKRKRFRKVPLEYYDSEKECLVNVLSYENIDTTSKFPLFRFSDNEEIVVNNDMKKRLEKGLNNVSKTYRDTFSLYCIENYSLKEISNKLNIPIGTAKSRLHRARIVLRKDPIIKSYLKN